jgi:uncharacterized protein YbjQ (UPF0145 family)
MKTLRHVGSFAFIAGLFVTIFAGVPWHVRVADDPAVPAWLQIAIFSLLGGILVVLVTVAIEQKTAAPAPEAPAAVEPDRSIPVINSWEIPGRRPSEILGVVQGHTVFAIWLGKDLSALIRLVLGGELTEYTEMMRRARTIAMNRMIAQAAELGADAVINFRYMTTSVVGSAAELLAYGTAVKLGE